MVDRQLSADEQEEIRNLRETLVSKLEVLTDDESYGKISVDEKENEMRVYFGPDWRSTLGEMNQLLNQPRLNQSHIPHMSLGGLTMFLLFVGAIISLFIYPGVITGAATHPITLKTNLELFPGETSLFVVDKELNYFSAEAEADFTLYLHDAKGRHLIQTSNKEKTSCYACEGSYTPPYMLEIDGEHPVLIERITYTTKN